MKVRLVLFIAAATAALSIAGCGGGDSSTDPASVAPAKSPLYVEVTVRPEGELSANIDSLAQAIAGVDDLGALIISELESSATDSGESFDYAEEVEPWLGEEAGIAFEEFDGEDFTGYVVAVQTTDADAVQEFVDKQTESEDEPAAEGAYEGVDFKVEADDGMTIGIFDDLVVFAEDEATFKDAVDASDGSSLADEEAFADAISAAPAGSFADVFVDIGALIEMSGDTIDPDTELFLEASGLEPEEATAVAGLIPGADRIEVDIVTDVTGENPPSGDASALLGSLPSDSVAALAAPELGERLSESIDRIDREGIPGEIPPNELKRTLKAAGIDLDRITASIGDVGVFVEGTGERNLRGALVLDTKSGSEAKNTVSNLGLLLRASGTQGITAIGGRAGGFSIRSPDLGRRPVVVAARGERIAVGYGLAATKKALAASSGRTLADSPLYREAVASLEGTPIAAFVDGPAALRLASDMVSPDDEGFREAKPFLEKIDYVAVGSGSSGDRATAKLIVGVGD